MCYFLPPHSLFSLSPLDHPLLLSVHLVCWCMRILCLVLFGYCLLLSFIKRGGDGVDGSARSRRSRTISAGCYHCSAIGAAHHATAQAHTPTLKSIAYLDARQWALGARLPFSHTLTCAQDPIAVRWRFEVTRHCS